MSAPTPQRLATLAEPPRSAFSMLGVGSALNAGADRGNQGSKMREVQRRAQGTG